MKGAWKTAKLIEVCEFLNGLWKGVKPPFVKAGVVRNTNFSKNGVLDFSDIAYLDVEQRKLDKRRLQYGDIILEKSGGGPKQPVGRVALFDKEGGVFSFSNFTSALRVRDSTQLDFRFLHLFLHWIYVSGKTAAIQSHSTGIRNLDGDAYKAISIAFPPLAEQKRIVAILDQALEAIDASAAISSKNVSLSNALFTSELNAIFQRREGDWTTTTVGQMGSTLTGATPKTSDRSNFGNDVPFIKPGDFYPDGSLDYDNEGLSSRGAQKARLIAAGSVLMVCIGATIGKCGVSRREIAANQQINALTPSKDVDPAFVYYQMRTAEFQKRVMMSAGQATLPIINKTRWCALEISIPPLSIQRKIAQRLEDISKQAEALVSVYERKNVALSALRASLLNDAFIGNL